MNIQGPGVGDSRQSTLSIDHEGRAATTAISVEQPAHAGFHHDSLFSFYSTLATGDVNVEFFSFQNDESDIDFIGSSFMLSVSGATTITIGRKTSGTPAGTEVTGVNLSLGRGKTYDYTCYGNAAVTGSVAGDIIAAPAIAAAGVLYLPVNGRLVIPNGECIFLSSSANITASVQMVGYWHD